MKTATTAKKLNHSEIRERATEMCEGERNMGICLACGADAWGVEPDARKYKCEECGELKVYGGEEIVMMLGL